MSLLMCCLAFFPARLLINLFWSFFFLFCFSSWSVAEGRPLYESSVVLHLFQLSLVDKKRTKEAPQSTGRSATEKKDGVIGTDQTTRRALIISPQRRN